jgi:hypothetical protein
VQDEWQEELKEESAKGFNLFSAVERRLASATAAK